MASEELSEAQMWDIDSGEEQETSSPTFGARAKSGTRHVRVRDPDATPCEGIGTLRLMADQAHGNEDDTRVQCPKCDGQGETEERAENATGYYSISWKDCWLCLGDGMVSLVVRTQFHGWARKNAAV
jgi:DnaJ-class molecular chaperone